VVTQAKAALASTNALDVTAQRAGVVSAACSPGLETLVLSTEARLAASLDTAARETIVREASFLTRSPLNASAFSGVATRIGSTGSTPDNIMETLLVVMKESINEANEDKKYYLQKLATYNEIAEALSDQLQDLVSAAGGLNGGSACDGSDEDPLSSQVQAEISGRLDGAKAALALACCAPGRDPYDCSFIMDPASCPSGPDDEVKTDVPLGVPATVGELRALSSFARAKLTAARTSSALLTRNIAEVTDRTSALCQELSRVVTTAP
jgi:hypothetical protein